MAGLRSAGMRFAKTETPGFWPGAVQQRGKPFLYGLDASSACSPAAATVYFLDVSVL